MSEAITQTVKPERTCGGCTMCCRVCSVVGDDGVELTDANSWCTHCRIGSGCAIYADRPRNCRSFSCGWLIGWFRDEDRPDKSKVLVMLGPKRSTDAAGNPIELPVLEFKACAPGALDTARAQRMIRRLAPHSKLPVAYSDFDPRTPSKIVARGHEQNALLVPGAAAAFIDELKRLASE